MCHRCYFKGTYRRPQKRIYLGRVLVQFQGGAGEILTQRLQYTSLRNFTGDSRGVATSTPGNYRADAKQNENTKKKVR